MNNRNTHSETILFLRRDVLVCVLLVITTLAIYWQVRKHEFIDFDDDLYITENSHVQNGLTLEGVHWSFTSTRGGNWHPITWLSHMLDIQFYGMNPGGHHLTSVLIHIANTVLLFFVFRRMTGDLWRSGFVAALFAVHPLHVESVAWVAERKDVLSAFFWMLTMWSYLRYVEDPGASRYFQVLLFFIFGLLSKSMIVTLPFVLLLLDYWPLGRIQLAPPGNNNNRRVQQRTTVFFLLREKIPLFLLAAGMGVVTFWFQHRVGAVGSLGVYPLYVRTGNALVSYVGYIVKMIWPFNLSVYYPHSGVLPVQQIVGAYVLLVAVSFIAVKFVRRYQWLAVGWLWYIGTLLPVIGIVQVGSQAMADRYTYVPLIGLFIIIAWGFPELASGLDKKKASIPIMATTLLLIFASIAWSQVRYWNNSITLLSHSINVTHDNYAPYNNLGLALERMGQTDAAIEHYSKALRINPGYKEAHNNLGNALEKQGKTQEAVKHFIKALQIDPIFREAHNNLGNALAKQGRTAEAIGHYSEALKIDADYQAAHYNLGIVLFKRGELDGAIHHYREAVRINPNDADIHNNLGVALAQQGRVAEAIYCFREALRLEPNNGEAYDNLNRLTPTLKTGCSP